MVYVYMEDSNEGLFLMQLAQSLYNVSSSEVKIGTFNGIFNIISHVQDIIGKLGNNDKVYYVHDNIDGNTDIIRIIKNVNRIIDKRIHLVPIVCCEYNILCGRHMHFFVNREVLELCMILRTCDKARVTEQTKSIAEFNDVYTHIRQQRNKKLQARNKNVSSTYAVENSITAEPLCKRLFKQAFQNDLVVYNKRTQRCGDCWGTGCCAKRRRICNISIKSNTLTDIEKQAILLQDAGFYKILHDIAIDNHIKCDDAMDIQYEKIRINQSIKGMYNTFNLNLQRCEYNIEVYKTLGKSRAVAETECRDLGFDDYFIDQAIRNTGCYN